MEYIKSYFKNNYEKGFEKFEKIPVLISVKDGKKTLLSDYKIYRSDSIKYNEEPNFAVFTGNVNNILLFDFDINKPEKINGVEWFENNFGPIKDLFGLITETPCGGIHAYCKYNDFFKASTVTIEENDQVIAMDVLSNGGVGFQGRHYNIIKNEELREIPEKFLEYLKKFKYELATLNPMYNTSFKLKKEKVSVPNPFIIGLKEFKKEHQDKLDSLEKE